MQKCTATRIVTIASGLFDLDDNQVKRRAHMLKKTANGYEIKQPIQFKKGEKFGYQGPVDRELADAIGVSEKEAKNMNDAHAKAEAAKAEADNDNGVLSSLLDSKVKDVIAGLTNLSDDELLTLLQEEQAGKARAGVMDAIEAELTARDNG